MDLRADALAKPVHHDFLSILVMSLSKNHFFFFLLLNPSVPQALIEAALGSKSLANRKDLLFLRNNQKEWPQ